MENNNKFDIVNQIFLNCPKCESPNINSYDDEEYICKSCGYHWQNKDNNEN